MDIDLLSKMIRELILENERVGLPGVGTFSADVVPASFADRGYSILPPYRRLSFSQDCSEDKLLAGMYADSNGLDFSAAKTYLTNFLLEMKEVLKRRKSITLPGLGRLRATKENDLFFVPDEGLDIYPEGLGLVPVSLKTHLQTEDEDEVRIEVKKPLEVRVPEPVAVPVAEPEVGEDIVRKERKRWWVPIMIIVLAAALALAAFAVLARVAPDFVDSILYTPEELRIIHY